MQTKFFIENKLNKNIKISLKTVLFNKTEL